MSAGTSGCWLGADTGSSSLPSFSAEQSVALPSTGLEDAEEKARGEWLSKLGWSSQVDKTPKDGEEKTEQGK